MLLNLRTGTNFTREDHTIDNIPVQLTPGNWAAPVFGGVAERQTRAGLAPPSALSQCSHGGNLGHELSASVGCQVGGFLYPLPFGLPIPALRQLRIAPHELRRD